MSPPGHAALLAAGCACKSARRSGPPLIAPTLRVRAAAPAIPPVCPSPRTVRGRIARRLSWHRRSEEHTSELQSLMRISYAVFCLKKKNNIHMMPNKYDIEQHTKNPQCKHTNQLLSIPNKIYIS